MSEALLDQSVDELRRAFDESFLRPRLDGQSTREELLTLRVGSRRLALRVREAGGILRAPPITRAPSDNPALVGLAVVRGVLTAVYDLQALVGGARRPAGEGWIALCAADRSAALLFDELTGYERVEPSEIHTASDAGVRAAAEQTVRLGGVHHGVVSVAEMLSTMKRSSKTAMTGSRES